MFDKLKTPYLRAIIRSVVGFQCAIWSPYWIKVAFPAAAAWRGKPENGLFALFLLAVLFFATIAATVFWVRSGNREWRLMFLARKFALGAITLDQYGLQTKQLIGSNRP